MKTIVIIFSLFFCNLLLAQKSDTVVNKYNVNGKKHGKWITYDEYEGDSLKNICTYNNGVINGTSYTYFPNNQLMCEIYFKNGIHFGKAKYYYKNGVISDIYFYEKGTVKTHIKFLGSGEIFQETDNGKVIQYDKGKPVIK
jgi:antitoxin component YwqK of YwqJK toxin-antitoxin module